MSSQYSINEFLLSVGGGIDVPKYATEFPSMTTLREKEVLYRLVKACFTGKGLIVDAGLFLGASTNAMGWGVKDSVNALNQVRKLGNKPIQAYDIALWNSAGFDKYLKDPLVKDAVGDYSFKNGDNYDFLLKRLLSHHFDLIDFHIGDIIKKAYVPDGQTVEIAFFDCLKNYERDWAAFKAFAPSYVPGSTIVIQQDYFFEDALENKIRQEFLCQYFECIGVVDTSAIFRLTRPIPSEYFVSDPLLSLSVDEAIALLEVASRRAEGLAFKIYAEVGVVRYMIKNDRLEDARLRLSEIERMANSLKSPHRPSVIVKQAQDWLEKKANAK